MMSLLRVQPSLMHWVLLLDVFDGERLRGRVGNPVVDTDELDDRGWRDSLQAVGGHPPRCSLHGDNDPPRPELPRPHSPSRHRGGLIASSHPAIIAAATDTLPGTHAVAIVGGLGYT